MRDPRFLEAWTLAADARRREANAQLLATVSDADRAEVDRLMIAWWSEVLTQAALDEQLRDTRVQLLRTQCSSLRPELQKFALAAPEALARDARDVDGSVGARILGESAAVVVRRATTAGDLDRAVRFLSDSNCWEAVEALQEALPQAPAWPPSTKTLSVASTSIEDLLGHHFDHVPSTDILVEEENKARERGVSAYFWAHYPELPLNETSLVRLSLVARRDWADLAFQADALPLRALRDWLWLSLHLDEDRESILALLRAAPPVFANDTWTGSTSALAALRAAIRHAERLHDRLSQATRGYPPAPDADANLRALEERELPGWLKQVAEAAAARSDGRVLLILFASTLVRHDLTPPWNGQRSWPASRHAMSAIYKALDPKPSLAECQKVASVGGVPSNRTTIDHATYLITSAVFDAEPKQIWAWYRELLLKNDDDLCWQARTCHRRAVCYFSLAERLGQLSAPFDEWRAHWKAIFVTDRERARFTKIDTNALHPSLHLLRVGTELLRQQPSRDGAWAFYEEILAHLHMLIANDTRRFSLGLDRALALDFIDVAPRIPGATWHEVVGSCRALLSGPKDRVYLAAVLLEAGAPFGEVDAAVEVSPHRLLDTVADLRNDINARHLCELVSAAAKGHEREQATEASAS